MIYLDHNATTPLDPRVFDAMAPFLKECWGNPSSPYRFGSMAKSAVEKARERVAEHLGCRAAEVVFTGGGTESDNLAIRGVVHALGDRGKHILTTAIEHHAVLHTCQSLEQEGLRVTYLPVGPDGVVDLEALAESLTDQTILVSVMHANNETGVIQPVEKIAALLKGRGIIFHVDAVQTAGKHPTPLAGLGADLVSFSAHKLYGPKGTGGLVVRNGTPFTPTITGGGQEYGRRAGTENVAGIVGLAEALSLACADSEAEGRRLRKLRDRLEREVCSRILDVRVNGAGSPRTTNTSSLTFESIDGESIVLGLDIRGICVATGSACSTGEPEPSHVLQAMGLSAVQAQGSIRISLGKSTKEQDIDFTVDVLSHTVERLRAISSVQHNGEARSRSHAG